MQPSLLSLKLLPNKPPTHSLMVFNVKQECYVNTRMYNFQKAMIIEHSRIVEVCFSSRSKKLGHNRYKLILALTSNLKEIAN